MHLIRDQAENAQVSEDRFMTKATRTSRGRFVPSDKKAPHGLHNVSVNCPVRCPAGSVAEVAVPAPQDRVQPVPDVRPGPAARSSSASCGSAPLMGDVLR